MDHHHHHHHQKSVRSAAESLGSESFTLDGLLNHHSQINQRTKAAPPPPTNNPFDDDSDNLKSLAREAQRETAESTAASARLINETVLISDNTLVRLNEQTAQLERISGTTATITDNAEKSYQSARNLAKYTGCLPVDLFACFRGSAKAREDRKLAKAQKALEEAADGKSLAETTNQSPRKAKNNTMPLITTATVAEDSAEEDERQIEADLADISSGLHHLKESGLAMRLQVERQDLSMQRIHASIDHAEYTLSSADRKIKKYG